MGSSRCIPRQRLHSSHTGWLDTKFRDRRQGRHDQETESAAVGSGDLRGIVQKLILTTVRRMAERRGGRRTSQISLIAFLAGIGLLGIAVLANILSILPELVKTVVAIVGVAGMIYGLATGALVAFSRDYEK